MAKRKTLFDDRPVEISELTYVIKQDLAALNQQIASLAAFTQSQHPKATRSKMDQEGEHNDNVRALLFSIRLIKTTPLIRLPGCRDVAREIGRRGSQLQGSVGSTHEEHSSIPFSNGELRLLRII